MEQSMNIINPLKEAEDKVMRVLEKFHDRCEDSILNDIPPYLSTILYIRFIHNEQDCTFDIEFIEYDCEEGRRFINSMTNQTEEYWSMSDDEIVNDLIARNEKMIKYHEQNAAKSIIQQIYGNKIMKKIIKEHLNEFEDIITGEDYPYYAVVDDFVKKVHQE